MSTDPGSYWEELERPAPDVAVVDGVEVRRGSRVRLHPRRGGDVMDIALDGRSAVVEGIDEDLEGNVSLTVVVDDDPGADLGHARQPGHRFFFTLGEVEPLGASSDPVALRVLVAGIGNVFLGDDGFGVAAADRLARRELPAGVDVVDFGIRGMDLAYALGDYEAAILLDAVPRGEAPGTVYVIEPRIDPDDVAIDTHGMDPVSVLRLAHGLGSRVPRTLVVGCEPSEILDPDTEDVVVELSEPVRAGVEEAVRVTERLLAEMQDDATKGGEAR